MTTPATIPEPVSEARAVPMPARLRYELFLLILVGIPAVFLLSSIAIARSASFPAEAGDPFLLHPDYPFSLEHADCGILIYGDSTAVTGIDPTVVEHATGMKTCNIAQSQSILEVAGPIALDTYLRNNRPPKYLVIQLAPETLARSDRNFFWPEGITVLLRRRSLPVALFTMIQHPVESYNFAMWAVKARIAAFVAPPSHFGTTEAIFASHQGLITLPKPPEKACSYKPAFSPPTAEWVRQLRQRYSTNGATVLIDVSPIPDCAPHAERLAAAMKGVTDNSLSLYPIGLFCDLDRHLTLEGAERSSEEIARQILALAHGPASQHLHP
jgi:hypothetical protein